jgi:hypothetical protein
MVCWGLAATEPAVRDKKAVAEFFLIFPTPKEIWLDQNRKLADFIRCHLMPSSDSYSVWDFCAFRNEMFSKMLISVETWPEAVHRWCHLLTDWWTFYDPNASTLLHTQEAASLVLAFTAVGVFRRMIILGFSFFEKPFGRESHSSCVWWFSWHFFRWLARSRREIVWSSNHQNVQLQVLLLWLILFQDI